MYRFFTNRKVPAILPAAALFLVSLVPGHALAAASGGFSGPGPGMVSVKQAVSLKDDAHVALKGHIKRHIGGEHYLFSDGTGEVTVEIDQDIWQGRSIGPSDTVEIYGEVDREWNGVSIEVDRLVTTGP